jgi:hypothetical protein
MPYFVECLRDVYRCCRTVLLVFKSFIRFDASSIVAVVVVSVVVVVVVEEQQ